MATATATKTQTTEKQPPAATKTLAQAASQALPAVGSDAPAKTSADAPTKIGQWSYAKTVEKLSRPIPAGLLKTKSKGGNSIPFLPWHRACGILDKYAPGWEYRVTNTHTTTGTVAYDKAGNSILGGNDCLVLTVEMTLHFSDGDVTRAATGHEPLSTSGYGDPSSNAESMALRRAASKFGLGRHLYEK